MVERIRKYIEEQGLLRHEDKYIVALSGGADSVCLLLLLKKLGYEIEAAHCNFHLRGEESNRDEEFVKSLCKTYNIPLHLIHFDTETYADIHKVSIEMAARELRYNYFEQLRRDIGAVAVCVAHHQDDSIETVLMNLIRGTGIQGLTGIKPKNEAIIRPLLCVSRNDIEQWLKEQGQEYVTDSTNLQADVVRNKLRLNVIPQLLNISPYATSGILQTSRRLQQAVKVLDAYTTHALSLLVHDNTIDINSLLKEPSPEELLFRWLTPYGFTPSTIEQISDSLKNAQTGTFWQSGSHEVCINRGTLLLQQKEKQGRVITIPEPGVYVYDEHKKIRVAIKNAVSIDRSPSVACLDAEKVAFPLTVRTVAAGDRFVPFGMNGSRLVSDFLTDLKLSLFDKRRQLVVVDASQRIIWLPGLRTDNRFCIDAHTTTQLQIEV